MCSSTLGLTRQLAHELWSWNITVNAVAPGVVLSNPAGRENLIAGTVLQRLGTPEDGAADVLLFASPLASWVTGETL